MEDIVVELTNQNVENVNSVLTGPQGPKGDPGEPGRDGISPTVNVGTVTTLSAGSQATVSNSGTSSNVILNFGIPQGARGTQGVPGENGANGVDGVSPTISVGNTYTLPAGSSASVENVGTDTDLILNFSIPQGEQGDITTCLSVPTIVNELPEVGQPNVFYFIPKDYETTTVTGDNLTLTITEEAGRIKNLSILGYLNSSLEPLTGDVDITVDSDTSTVPLGNNYLARVNDTYDEIVNDGVAWYIIKRIGYIESYDGETITTDYVSTSGTLTTGDEVYYILDESEQIEITDETITDVLNAIITYKYEPGTVTITTSANVQADLTIIYYSYVVNNQYDKYVYMIDTANYESLSVDDSGTPVIPDESITTTKLADGAVTDVKIATSAVTTGNIADDAITTVKLDDESVTPAKTTFCGYSTTKRLIGKWVDGKDLYQQCVPVTLPATITDTQTSTVMVNFADVGLSNIDTIFTQGIILSDGTSQSAWVISGNPYFLRANASKPNAYLYAQTNRSSLQGLSGYIIACFTELTS